MGGYLEAVRSNASAEYPTLQGDFFPYSDRSDQYWSGYFSSRPLVKSLARIFQAHLRYLRFYYLCLCFHNYLINLGRYFITHYEISRVYCSSGEDIRCRKYWTILEVPVLASEYMHTHGHFMFFFIEP